MGRRKKFREFFSAMWKVSLLSALFAASRSGTKIAETNKRTIAAQCCLFCGERAFGSLPRRVDCLPQSPSLQGQERCIPSQMCFAVFDGNFDLLSPLHSIPQLHSQLGREEFEKWKCLHFLIKLCQKCPLVF
jgi:hypothetical protein